ncbi:MAG: glutamate--tRNA ligase [Phycisphaerae bacterium]
MTTPTMRTRFAPSPTGHLHIGGARTALYNWLLARRHGGVFVVRIEDTDVERNVAGAEDQIRDDLDWLGLGPDESPWSGGAHGPYRQSERLELYTAHAGRLLDDGHAYYAFDTTAELDAMRATARAEKRNFGYPRPAAAPSQSDADRARADGRPAVIRMKAPDADVTVHDCILGDVVIRADELDDFVIVKSNGWPTYHFAVVVDDALMNITHVVRAQEHLMNTPKHQVLQDALGLGRPIYAHVPIVMNMDGSKMSKRDKHRVVRKAVQNLISQKRWTQADAAAHARCDSDVLATWLDGADAALTTADLLVLAEVAKVAVPEIDVHDFRRRGYLPEALLNFIALAGWSPGEDREQMTVDEMIERFAVERVGKTSARFDREKLLAFNTDACAAAAAERLRAGFRDYARVGYSPMADLSDATLDSVLAACRGFRTFADVDAKAGVLFAPDDAIAYDPKAVRKVLEKGDGRGYTMLETLLPVLEAAESWAAEALDAAIQRFCDENGAKLGDVAQPLRVALAGRTVSPAIGETLALAGRETTLRRIRRCLARRSGE